MSDEQPRPLGDPKLYEPERWEEAWQLLRHLQAQLETMPKAADGQPAGLITDGYRWAVTFVGDYLSRWADIMPQGPDDMVNNYLWKRRERSKVRVEVGGYHEYDGGSRVELVGVNVLGPPAEVKRFLDGLPHGEDRP